MTDLSAVLDRAGIPPRYLHPDDIERAHGFEQRGDDGVRAYTRAVILNALESGHATLDEIEDVFGEDALSHVFGATALRDVEEAAAEGGDDQGPEAAAGDGEAGELVPRPGEIDGAEGPEAEGGAQDPGDERAAADSEGAGRAQALAERLASLSEELRAIADELRELTPPEDDVEAPDSAENVTTGPTAEAEMASIEQDAAPDGSRAAPVHVQHADDIAKAGERVHAEPSDPQKEAGNYRMAHVRFDGLDLTIENPKGGIRRGQGPDGKAWEAVLPAAYGYLKRTTGADGDHVDVYLSDSAVPGRVFIVDQVDPATRAFDEHKVVLGARSKNEARQIFVTAFSDRSGPRRLGGITEMSTEQFKDWLASGDTTGPVARHVLTNVSGH
jgi:hypothetical protein